MNSWKQCIILVDITGSTKSVPGRFKWQELKGSSIILRHVASNSDLHLQWYNTQCMAEATVMSTLLGPCAWGCTASAWQVKTHPAPDSEPSERALLTNELNCLCETGRDICRCKLNTAEGSSRVVTFYKLLSLAWLSTPHRAFSLIQQGSKQPGKKISFKEI